MYVSAESIIIAFFNVLSPIRYHDITRTTAVILSIEPQRTFFVQNANISGEKYHQNKRIYVLMAENLTERNLMFYYMG